MLGRILLGLSILLLAANTSYAQTFDQGVYYQIQAHHSGKCLDVRDVSVSNGGRLQQWDCAAYAQRNQMWTVVPTGSGSYRIVSANSAKCADVINSATTNGTYIQQYDCNLSWAQWNQSFSVAASPSAGYWRLSPTNATGTKCLDVEGVSTSNGANIQLWDCGPAASTNQDWAFVPYITRTPLTNLQVFGYYISSPVSAWGNVRDHGNIGQVTTVSDLANAAAQTGVKAQIYLDFFARAAKQGGDIYSYSSSDGGLVSNYQAIWASLKPTIQTYQSSVGMFYLSDEPYWNFDAIGSGFSHAEIYQMLDLVASMIKADFPNIPIAVVEGWPSVNAGVTYPASIDWAGFDYYGCESGCSPSYMTLHNALKANLLANQKMLIVPYGFVDRNPYSGSLATTQAEQDNLVAKADFYINLALSEPKAIGLLVFTGESIQVAPSEALIGTWDMPSVKAKWRFLMRGLGFGTP
jgi:hypothetical protein